MPTPTLTRKGFERIVKEFNCPMTGWKGGYKAHVEKAEWWWVRQPSGKKTRRIVVTLKNGHELYSLNDWRQYNGGSGGFTSGSVARLNRLFDQTTSKGETNDRH